MTTTLSLVGASPEQRADWILDNAVQVAVRLIRNGTPESARLMLDRAQRHVEPLLTGGAS